MAEPYVGEIRMMALSFAPKGWAYCDGQSLPVRQNQALFSLLGNQYGGNQSMFNLPDLRGRAPLHQGENEPVGSQGGESEHALTVSEMPAHQHRVIVGDGDSTDDPGDNYIAHGQGHYYAEDHFGGDVMDSSTVAEAGASQPHDNMQPYLVVPFFIALQGIYPSKN